MIFFNIKTDSDSISLEEYVYYLENNVDFDDPESIKSSAFMLQRLANEKSWYFDILHSKVKKTLSNPESDINSYTSNSIVLSNYTGREQYFIRTNTWYPQEHLGRAGLSEKTFAEDGYHDHTFDLLTVGLLGSGYETDLYEYDYDKTRGIKNEYVNVNFLGKYNLNEGCALFMQKNKIIHKQYPSKEHSVSLNLIVNSRTTSRQYEFDLINSNTFKIKTAHYVGYKNTLQYQNLINILMTYGDDNSMDLIMSFLKKISSKSEHYEPTIIHILSWLKDKNCLGDVPLEIKRNWHFNAHLDRLMK